MMKTTIAATIVALGVATPANAHHCRNAHHYRQQYYPQYQYDPGPAIARGIFGAVVGTIPASAGGYTYAPAYDTLSDPIATSGCTGPEKHVGRIGERDGMDCRSDGEQ